MITLEKRWLFKRPKKTSRKTSKNASKSIL